MAGGSLCGHLLRDVALRGHQTTSWRSVPLSGRSILIHLWHILVLRHRIFLTVRSLFSCYGVAQCCPSLLDALKPTGESQARCLVSVHAFRPVAMPRPPLPLGMPHVAVCETLLALRLGH